MLYTKWAIWDIISYWRGGVLLLLFPCMTQTAAKHWPVENLPVTGRESQTACFIWEAVPEKVPSSPRIPGLTTGKRTSSQGSLQPWDVAAEVRTQRSGLSVFLLNDPAAPSRSQMFCFPCSIWLQDSLVGLCPDTLPSHVDCQEISSEPVSRTQLLLTVSALREWWTYENKNQSVLQLDGKICPCPKVWSKHMTILQPGT